jgi:tetratricopeptide (TPR) repeat protein
MQSNLEDLHRQASGHYLKGDFPAAIEAWQAVLREQPDDERAREGIRLCEQLAGGFDPETTPPPVQEVQSPSPPEPSPPDEGLALDLTQIEQTPVPVADEVVATPPPAPESAQPSAPPTTIDAAAADELRRRTGALLYEAQQQYELGKPDDAMKTLERVLILDDENDDAAALKARIESERDGEQPPAAVAVPPSEPVAESIPALDLDADLQPSPEGDPTGPSIPGFSSTQEGLSQDFLSEPPPLATPTDPLIEQGHEQPIEPPVEPPSASAAPSKPKQGMPPWLQDRRVALGLVGGVLVLVAVAFVKMSGGAGMPEAPVGVADPANPVARATEPAAEPAPHAAPEPSSPPPDPTVLMRRAEQAFESEDYAAAMVAYDTVLEQAPGHVEAGVKLKVAVERYREQQERRKQWDEAVRAFDEGNYALALRSFYRMPASEFAADLERHKVNGWYNLGVLALQANDCNRAIENLEEAQRVDPDDEGVLAALDLAELCKGPAVKEDIRGLRIRSLND